MTTTTETPKLGIATIWDDRFHTTECSKVPKMMNGTVYGGALEPKPCDCGFDSVIRPILEATGIKFEPAWTPGEVRYPKLPLSNLDVVAITERELLDLPDYSMSVPTGVIIGKWWRRDANVYKRDALPHWLACCFGPGSREDTAAIYFCKVRLL